MRGSGRIIGVGSRTISVEVTKDYGTTDIVNYKDGDRIIMAGGNIVQAISMVKPGGVVANVNYHDSGKFILIPPRTEWGRGMAHKTIKGGLRLGGRLRMERLIDLVKYNRVDISKLVTHVFKGFENIEEALLLMKTKNKGLIKPVVIM